MLKKGLAYLWGDRARLCMALGVFTAVLRTVFSFMPEVVEQVYARGFFLGVRWVLDYTIGWCPIPFSYLVILGLLAYWTWKVVRNRKQARPPGWARLWRALRNLGGFLGAFLFLFCFLWGFNYERVPIEQHLGLTLDSMDVESLCLEAEWAGIQAEADRAAIVGATDDSLSAALLPADLENEVRACVAKAMEAMDYPFAGSVRGRVLVPGGWMLRVGIAGIYNPFTGEGNVSGAQTPQKVPFTMAHEMSHGCGFGDEGSCNFIGMVACGLSDDPFIRYSGQMAYWLYLYNDLVVADPQMAKMLAHNLAPGIRADQRANYNNYQRYHGKIAEIGNQVNNAYLHSQGVQGGIKSYDRVTIMRAAWHRKTEQQNL